MSRFGLILSALLILCFLSVATAQDFAPQKGTSRENACNEGGLFFRDGVSLCETEWHWECGWYIANRQNTGAPIPDWCGMDQLPATTPTLPTGIYYCHEVYVGAYAKFGADLLLLKSSPVYSDANCTVLVAGPGFGNVLIYSASAINAAEICFNNFGGNIGHTGNPMIYDCS